MARKTSIYLTDELAKKLRAPKRGPSSAVSKTIDRYDVIISIESRKLSALFSESEWNAMRNACNGTWWEPAGTIRGGVLLNIQDSLDDEISMYGAVRDDLESKIAALSPAQQFALVEMIEEWWENHGSGKN